MSVQLFGVRWTQRGLCGPVSPQVPPSRDGNRTSRTTHLRNLGTPRLARRSDWRGDGREPLYMYVMSRIRGVSHLDFILCTWFASELAGEFSLAKKPDYGRREVCLTLAQSRYILMYIAQVPCTSMEEPAKRRSSLS